MKIHSTHWLPKNTKGELPEVRATYTVEMPAYPNGGAGELWVLRTAEGKIELVMSNVEPNHPQWPGKIKGWPEPSLTYQRERWELSREIAEGRIDLLRSSLEEFQKDKQAHLNAMWEIKKVHDRFSIAEFSGPDDPAFAERQKKRYVEGLRDAEKALKQLLREKP